MIKDNGAIVLTAQTPFDKILGASNLNALRYEWIWQKNRGTGYMNAKKMPLKSHENVLVFYKKLPKYNPQKTTGNPYKRINCSKRSLDKGNYSGNGLNQSYDTISDGMRYPLSVIDFAVVERTLHPTQKPVALFEYLIKTYTNEGDLVLDNCAGSFTTAIASENLKRNWICIEKEKEYCEIGLKRINENREKLGILDKCDIIDIWQ